MYLLAISGGPDSMFLLDKYKKKNVVVAHVNYNKRKDSNKDQKIIKIFCENYNIPYNILNVTDQSEGNFQNWARDIRYNFFKKIYYEKKCKKLIIAHHKDDFIETALMQQTSNRIPRFFGIKKNNNIYEMNIYRPYINTYWKKDIIEYNKKNNVPFIIDSSNNEIIYTRNKIRKELKQKTQKEKRDIFSWFLMSNKILKKKFKRVDKKVKKIIKNNHKLKMYRSLYIDKKEILYEIIHKELGNVKLSSNKINSLIKFIDCENGNKKFIINDKTYILKKNKKLYFENI